MHMVSLQIVLLLCAAVAFSAAATTASVATADHSLTAAATAAVVFAWRRLRGHARGMGSHGRRL